MWADDVFMLVHLNQTNMTFCSFIVCSCITSYAKPYIVLSKMWNWKYYKKIYFGTSKSRQTFIKYNIAIFFNIPRARWEHQITQMCVWYTEIGYIYLIYKITQMCVWYTKIGFIYLIYPLCHMCSNLLLSNFWKSMFWSRFEWRISCDCSTALDSSIRSIVDVLITEMHIECWYYCVVQTQVAQLYRLIRPPVFD